MIRMVPCSHKIGTRRCPLELFQSYHEPDEWWNPWLICLLASTNTREGANMLEASLILHFETNAVNIENNLNWTIASDYGGEGPTREDEAHLEHYVYIALEPGRRPPAASAHPPEAIGDITRNRSGLSPFAVAELGRRIAEDGWGERREEPTIAGQMSHQRRSLQRLYQPQ